MQWVKTLISAYLIYKQTASTFGHKLFLFEKTPKQYHAGRLLPKHFYGASAFQ